MAVVFHRQPVICYSISISKSYVFSKSTFPQVLQRSLYCRRNQALRFSTLNGGRHVFLGDHQQDFHEVAGNRSCKHLVVYSTTFLYGWKECKTDVPFFRFLREKCLCVTLPMALASMLALALWATSPAYAADVLKTCACLLKECRVELARCIADPACAANIACLQTCNNRPDETECQIGCGDVFENTVVDSFNECAVSRNQCVPKKTDDGKFPIPPSSAVVNEFNTEHFNGKWYISSGLNPTFDTFDCQLHEFSSSSNRLNGKLSWRIQTPDGGFITRSTVQSFVQDPKNPGILYNHDNEFLHYQDDWYILSARIKNKPDDYIFVYYRGRNDAWDGYGGAVVYTRSKTVPLTIVPELQDAAKRAGLDFSKFQTTDNTCGPEPTLFARLEKKVEEGEKVLVKEAGEIEGKVENIGRTEIRLLQNLKEGVMELQKDESLLLNELGDEGKQLLKELRMEAEEVEKLFGKALPIRKLR